MSKVQPFLWYVLILKFKWLSPETQLNPGAIQLYLNTYFLTFRAVHVAAQSHDDDDGDDDDC